MIALAGEPVKPTTQPERVFVVNRKNLHNSPSPGVRELEGGGIHHHLTPDLIRSSPIQGEDSTRDYVEEWNWYPCALYGYPCA